MRKNGQKYVIFRVAGERFGFPVSTVQSIVCREPAASTMPLGQFVHRGQSFPACDLRGFLGYPTEARQGQFMIVQSRSQTLACRVDSVEGIAFFTAKEIQEESEFLHAPDATLLTGIVVNDEEIIGLLTPDELLAECPSDWALPLAA